jgi:hypothetical protein
MNLVGYYGVAFNHIVEMKTLPKNVCPFWTDQSDISDDSDVIFHANTEY